MDDTTVQVFDSFQPIKQAGSTIALTAAQTLGTSANGADLLTTTGADTVYMQVDGPRLSLPADLVMGTYPAQGSQDSPDEYLPHIVIARRTLAWERPGPTPTAPWLALLLVKESEWRAANTPPAPSLTVRPLSTVPLTVATEPAAAVLEPKLVERALVPGNNPQGPNPPPPISVITQVSFADQVPGAILQALTVSQIKSQDPLGYAQLTNAQTGCGLDPSTNVSVLFLPNDTLTQILPAEDELGLLCHVKLGSDDSETLIVVGNRLPNSTPPAGDTAPELHTALLVSLERRSDLYGTGNTRKAGASAAMVVLYQWTFTPSTGADFADAIQAIRYTPNGGILRFGNRPTIPSPGTAGIAPMVATDGFLLTPLPLAPAGEANYRGPLQPYEAPNRSNTFAVAAAPQLLLDAAPADPVDYSHATAFELGRLIAVSDSGIMEDLKAIHGVLNLPKNFVATSGVPQTLLEKDWGEVDSTWAEEPWSGTVGDFSDRATADVSGVASQIAAWQTQISDAFQGVSAQAGGPAIGQIATASVTAETLQSQLADVYNAAV